MSAQYDLIIIGGGPGGYTAAAKAAAFGMRTALIEMGELGGSCVNTGCIPTKALLQATTLYRDMMQASDFGILAQEVGFDLKKMQAYKDHSVEEFRKMIWRSLTGNQVDLISGEGRLHKDNEVEVITAKGSTFLKATNVILATGSRSRIPNISGIELPQVMTSRELLEAEEWKFDCLTVLGGGVIGVELATVFAALGSKVTIIEQKPYLLSNMGTTLSVQVEKSLREKGIDIFCNASVTQIDKGQGDTVWVTYQTEEGAKKLAADRVLIAAGRVPFLGNVLAEDCEVTVEEGRPVTRGTYRTTQKNVFAIGDVISRIRLAHVAISEATYVVESLAGTRHRMQLTVVPNGMYVALPVVPLCIYTAPEIASVGFTEEEAHSYNMKLKCGMAQMKDNGKAILSQKTDGFIRLIFEAYTDTLVGAQIMCSRATDMIGEMATAIANGLTAYQLSTAMRAHPTYGEAVTQAIEDALTNG